MVNGTPRDFGRHNNVLPLYKEKENEELRNKKEREGDR